MGLLGIWHVIIKLLLQDLTIISVIKFTTKAIILKLDLINNAVITRISPIWTFEQWIVGSWIKNGMEMEEKSGFATFLLWFLNSPTIKS